MCAVSMLKLKINGRLRDLTNENRFTGARIGHGYDRISKAVWRMYGGLENPRLCRVTRGRSWAYFYKLF